MKNYKDNKVQTYLKKYMLQKFKRTGVNDWYASKSNKELVNTKNRTQLALQTYETDIKKNLKKIPILVSLVAFVKKKSLAMPAISLSICIPIYNCAEFIGAAQDSILPQADARVEVIIYDGGSTDGPRNSRQILEFWPSLKYTLGKSRGGILISI